jgi:hypothetical protein
MKRTYWYAAMTKDEVQHSRMTFYFAVKLKRKKPETTNQKPFL